MKGGKMKKSLILFNEKMDNYLDKFMRYYIVFMSLSLMYVACHIVYSILRD